jgi:hypothetical protein
MRTYGITIEEEAQTGHENDDPLIILTVNSLVDLPHANISILRMRLVQPRHSFPQLSWGIRKPYLFMVEISRAVSLV